MTSSPSYDGTARTLVLVGMGPRGTGLFERLVSNASAGLGGGADGRVVVHLVDPFPAGGGRVWRDDQSRLLRLNTTAEDLTAFVDDTVEMAGPVAPGPTFFAWCCTHGVDLADPALAAEAEALGPLDFPSRRLASAYFGFALDRARRRAPDRLEVVDHPCRAVDLIQSEGDDRVVVVLEDGDRIVADAVVLLTSHVDVRPAPRYAALASFADDHGLTYLPPGYGGDLDLSAVGAGQDTIVRGFGLGFVDLMVLLTQGRGGRFEPGDDGRLRYRCSGREPRLLVGSRRGVPYHCKPTYRLRTAKPAATTTTFCTSARIGELLDRGTPIDFWTDLWPLIGREVTWAYYRELALGHPGRVTTGWDEFATTFAELEWGSPGFDRWLASVVPDPADRLDLLALDRPLDGARADEGRGQAAIVRDHVRTDLARRQDVRFSADLAAFHGLLAVLAVVGPALASPLMDPRSLIADVNGWFMGFFSFYASGPPPDRLEQLLALEEAGVVRFLGGGLEIDTDPRTGAFVAHASGCPDGVSAGAMIDATLPGFDLGRTSDPLLGHLADHGVASTRVLTDTDGARYDTGQLWVDAEQRLVSADGTSAPATYALGLHTMVKATAFARPGTNAAVHRLNDQVARALLAPPRTDPDTDTNTDTDTDPVAALSGAGDDHHAH